MRKKVFKVREEKRGNENMEIGGDRWTARLTYLGKNIVEMSYSLESGNHAHFPVQVQFALDICLSYDELQSVSQVINYYQNAGVFVAPFFTAVTGRWEVGLDFMCTTYQTLKRVPSFDCTASGTARFYLRISQLVIRGVDPEAVLGGFNAFLYLFALTENTEFLLPQEREQISQLVATARHTVDF